MIEQGVDGYYHPRSVAEVQDIVRHAHDHGFGVRVRGSGHSEKAAIHNQGFSGEGLPPKGAIEIMLDRMRGVTITPEGAGETALVSVEAGCHLGRAPYDPTKTSSWANSLNGQLQAAGYALDDLGGISHQTISGFMLTGSAGGSIKHTLTDDLVRLQLVDGTGRLHDVSHDDPDPQKRDLFHAAGVSMGLLGIVVKVWLRVGRSYNVDGQEVTGPLASASVDLLGPGDAARPGIRRFLEDTPYTRILWWPQNDFNRVQVWSCGRLEPTHHFAPQPFQILDKPRSLAGSLLQTVLGNLADLSKVPNKLEHWYAHLERDLDGDEDMNACHTPQRGERVEVAEIVELLRHRFERGIEKSPRLPEGAQKSQQEVKELWDAEPHRADEGLSEGMARLIAKVIRWVLDGALDNVLVERLGRWLDKQAPDFVDELVSVFVSDGTKRFQDSWMCGLPMDNQMDDELWDTQFTELWIDIAHAETVMKRLADYYAAGGDPKLSYARSRSYACEIYAAAASDFWLSPAYGTNVIRINPFWFRTWEGDVHAFFAPYFEMMKDLAFRPHWGKVLPQPSAAWRAHYRKVLPRLDDFLALRAELDPKRIFVTPYWRDHLGIT